MDRHEALALVRSVRGWSGMVGARRLSHALDALVLASGLVGEGAAGASPLPGYGHHLARARLHDAGPVLLEGLTGWPCAAGVAALGWASAELASIMPREGLAVPVGEFAHPASVGPAPAAGECGGSR